MVQVIGGKEFLLVLMKKSLRRHINKYLANKYDNANIEPDEDHLSGSPI